ncbi:hypothetical protein GGR58DRAFT_524583 [Xylaria digitata]|nr:hypothetical protein GGR58DRAFT_524583 [Xylaria digitata]
MGQHDEAHLYLQKASDMRQELLESAPDQGIYNPHLVREWCTLAGYLWLKGDYSTAWKYADDSTKLGEEIYPKDSLNLLQCYTVLGNILNSQGKLEESKRLHLKSLDICTHHYGDHPDTAFACHRYGKILAEEGNTLGAIDYVKRAIEILSDYPCLEAANARSNYYLSKLFDKAAKGINLTMEDFDKLVNYSDW